MNVPTFDIENLTPAQHQRLPFLKLLRRIFFIILGASIVSVGLEILLVPNNIIDGGIVGISIICSYLFQIKLGYFLFFLNLPFFYIGYKYIGKTFALSSLLGVTTMSLGTFLLHHASPLTTDPLLAAVFGGITIGIGVGTVIRFGGSLDGTEIIAIILNNKSPFSVGEMVMICNLFILSTAGFVFGWDRAMYSLIAYYIAYKMIDVTIEGLNESKVAWVISDKTDIIYRTINDRLGRGATFIYGEGCYTNKKTKILFCIFTRLEEAKFKLIIQEIDPDAFLAIGNIRDVQGGQFKKEKIH